jgi:hypothetical protein
LEAEAERVRGQIQTRLGLGQSGLQRRQVHVETLKRVEDELEGLGAAVKGNQVSNSTASSSSTSSLTGALKGFSRSKKAIQKI